MSVDMAHGVLADGTVTYSYINQSINQCIYFR